MRRHGAYLRGTSDAGRRNCINSTTTATARLTTCRARQLVLPVQGRHGQDQLRRGVVRRRAGHSQQCVPGQVTSSARTPSARAASCVTRSTTTERRRGRLPAQTVGGALLPRAASAGTGCASRVACAGCGPTGIDAWRRSSDRRDLRRPETIATALSTDVTGAAPTLLPSGLCGRGACKAGQLCADPTGPVCQGAVDPVTETCNGVDDNCNGIVDGHSGPHQRAAPRAVRREAPEACKQGRCPPRRSPMCANQVDARWPRPGSRSATGRTTTATARSM